MNMVFRRAGAFRLWGQPRSKINFESEVGDGTGSSTVMAPLLWIARTFPEAPIGLWQSDEEGQETQIRDNQFLRRMRRPNPFYSGSVLMQATIIDRTVDGNAYWIKVRDASENVREYWWAPTATMTPKGDEENFITHYEYKPGSDVIILRPEDVIHFRFGMDNDDPRKGQASLKSVLREVFTDDEAANFTASLLRNSGVPGLLVSPEVGAGAPSDEDVKATKAYIREKFTGDNRGEALVMSGPTKVQQFGFSPEQLLLKDLRRVPEERVTAILGVPAIVCGLGAGLDKATFCLPADARVWTVTGPQRIADIRPGRVVWSFTDGHIEPRRVLHAGKTGVKPLLEIRTKNRTVRATGNHPFLVRVPGSMTEGPNQDRHPSYAWKRADALSRGDYVVQPRALPDQGGEELPTGEPATPEMLQFMGALIGDGTVNSAGIRMAMPPADRCAAHYQSLALQLFTKQARVGNGSDSSERMPIAIQERERYFGFSSARDAGWLIQVGLGERAHTKRVPSWVWTLSRDLRLSFLAGLVDTDGSIDKRGALTFGFCNRELATDIRDLLVSVGIQASNVLHGHVSVDRLPNPGRKLYYDKWTFTASSADAISRIPFADPLYRERVEKNAGRLRSDGFDAAKAGLDGNLGFYKVISIRELPPELIYDLEIEGSHSFIADGCVVHNTNYTEARQAAYEQAIIPSQTQMAEDLWHQALSDFFSGEEIWALRVGFDYSRVRVLQEDQNKLANRMATEIRAGIAKRSEARRALGHKAGPEDEVYIIPMNTALVPADGSDPRIFTAPKGTENP